MREKKAKSEKNSTPEAKKKSDKKKKARKSDRSNLEDLYANLTIRNSQGLKRVDLGLKSEIQWLS